jgi:CRISPR-associated protein Csb2
MLALEVDFLMGRYSASDYRNRDRHEWPPHPARLYSALVAACYQARLGESARAALLWLEAQPPPSICAGEAAPQAAVTAFVPVNDPAADYLPDRAEKQPRAFPSVVPERPVVHFVWPEARPDAALLALLQQVAAAVTYLGSSRSPARVRVCERPPEPTWVPDEAGRWVLRVPARGRLQQLDWCFDNGLRPPPGAFQSYAPPGDRRDGAPDAGSVFGDLVVFRLAGPVRMEAETTLKLTDALRDAVLSLAGEGGDRPPDLLSGHGEHPHAAYVALPFVDEGQRHADGHILGLAVVLPRAIDPATRRQALRPLAGLRQLDVPGAGRFDLERVTAASGTVPENLRPAKWVGPAATWATVTPVLLDHFPKKHKPVERVVADGCRFVGLPEPLDVRVSHHAPLHGVPPSGAFLKVRQAGEAPRLAKHVTLTFDRPVRGPVLLGAGRYFGLGLLRPLRCEVPGKEGDA